MNSKPLESSKHKKHDQIWNFRILEIFNYKSFYRRNAKLLKLNRCDSIPKKTYN